MTSELQLIANQNNARKSTGPQTEAGKAASSINGLKHGLTGLMRLLPDEDQTDYARHCEGIVADLRPHGELELRLAQAIADDHWRIDRIRRIEQSLFLLAGDDVQASIDHNKQLALYSLYESRLNRNIRNNHAELRKLRQDRAQAPTVDEQSAAAELLEAAKKAGLKPLVPQNGFGSSFTSVPDVIEAEMAALGAIHRYDVTEYDPANWPEDAQKAA
jgi:hypothetical protein